MPIASLRGCVLACALIIVGAGAVYAQSASQVPPTTAPPAVGPVQALVFPGTPGLGAPEGAESLNVSLSGVEISGGKPNLAATEEEIRSSLAGRRVTLAEIFTRARDLEAAYNQAGYVLVRVVVPAQTLRDGGVLKLTVVEGFIERVDTTNVPERLQARVSGLLEPLVGRSDIQIKEIERRVLLAGDTPGVKLQTALATGAQPGGTVLLVTADLDLVIPFLGADNTLPASLGTFVVHTGVDFNNLLSVGETIYFRASAHPSGNGPGGMFGTFDDDPRYRSLTTGFTIPVGPDGLTLNVEGMITQTTPTPVGAFQTSSLFEKLSATWSYPFVRSRKFTLNGSFTFDGQNEYQNLITNAGRLGLFEDRLRVVRTGLDFAWSPNGTLTGAAVLSLGLDALNARTAAEAATTAVPLSRQGADATFAKLEAKLGYSQTLSSHFAFSINARAQTSFGQPLLQSEQFSIANLQEISTLDSGGISGDSGWVVRVEPSFPFPFERENVNLTVAPYVFGAVGSVILHQPTVLESPLTHAAALGAGVRVGGMVGDVQASLALEYGWAWRNPGTQSSRFTVVGSLRF